MFESRAEILETDKVIKTGPPLNSDLETHSLDFSWSRDDHLVIAQKRDEMLLSRDICDLINSWIPGIRHYEYPAG